MDTNSLVNNTKSFNNLFEETCSFRVLKFLEFYDIIQLLTLSKTTNKCIHLYLQQELLKVDQTLTKRIMKFSKKDVLYNYGIHYGKTILKFSQESLCNIVYPKKQINEIDSLRKGSKNSLNNDEIKETKDTKKGKKGNKRKNSISSEDRDNEQGNLAELDEQAKKKGKFYKDKQNKNKHRKSSKNEPTNLTEEKIQDSIKQPETEIIPEKLGCCKGKAIKNTIITKEYIILHDEFNQVFILDVETHRLLVNIEGVKQISCPNNLIWLTESNKLYAANGWGNLNYGNFAEDFGYYLIAENVDKVFPTYNYVVFCYKKKSGEEVTQTKRYHFLRNFAHKQLEKGLPEEIPKIEKQFFELENDQIKQISIGLPQHSDKNNSQQSFVDFYILSTSHRIYKGVFDQFDNNGYVKFEKLSLEEWEFFKDKKISQLWSNDKGSYIAQEDTSIPGFKDWDNKRLYNWFNDIYLQKYSNVILSTKATGKKILEATQEWYEDNLGLEDPSEIVHINTEIRKVKNVTYLDPILYAWGLNQERQLGINTGTKEVKSPYKFELKIIDFLNNDDYVEFVGIDQTASWIITKNRRYFLSAPKHSNAQEKEIKQKVQIDGNKAGSKKIHEHTPKKAASNIFWTEVTDYFKNDHLNSYQMYNTFSKKDDLYFLCYNTRVFTKKKFLKLPDAKTAWDRIIWDKRLNKYFVDEIQDSNMYSQVDSDFHVKIDNNSNQNSETKKFENDDYLLAVKGMRWDIDEITYKMFMEGSDDRTWDSIKYIRHEPTGKIIWHRKAKLWIVDDLIELNEI